MSEHHIYIKRCFELALRGKGYAAPNPIVGAVLVHDGRIIGEGWHQQYGHQHAEVNCLESVAAEHKHLISESTMYVSLEPCAHFGKTPPCATRLVQEKVKEVIICNIDPFEQVEGRGIKILNDAGIKTADGILDEEGKWLNRRFFTFHQKKRPYVILKWAQTQNGYFAPIDRSRTQLSNKHSQQLVHKWRTEEAAIMIGHQTAISDNPKLTARLWQGKQPLRVVLDKRLALSHEQNVFNSDAPSWIINEQKDEVKGNVSFVKLTFDEILLTRILEKLHEADILSLIVEGGSMLLQSFIDLGLWDEARVFSAETILEEGLEAPTLKDANPAFAAEVDTDTLHVYTNKNAYPYIQGMEL